MNKDQPCVSGRMLFGVNELLQKNKIDSEQFYRQFGLTSSIENKLERLLPFDIFVKILSTLKTYIPSRHPSLAIVSLQKNKMNIPLYQLVCASPCLEIALKNAFQYRFHTSEITYWDWFFQSDFLICKRCSYANTIHDDSEHSLYVLAQTTQMINQIIGENNIEYLALTRKHEANVKEIERFFNCPVLLNQDYDAVVMKQHMLYKQNVNYDKDIYNQILHQLLELPVMFKDQQTFAESVKCLIFNTLTTDHCNIESIGKMMHVHHRTIQYRLKKEATNFKALVIEVRNSVAKRMLAQPEISLLQISNLLGYSEASAFTRAFKNKNKLSPKMWRKTFQQSKLTEQTRL